MTTAGNSPLSTGVSDSAPAERGETPEVSTRAQSLHSAAVTMRSWAQGSMGRSRDYWVPPNLLTQPPASVAELSAYAHRGGWTASAYGVVRGAGVLWYLAVALPVTVVCRYVEWFAQRPTRGLAAFVIWLTVIRSTPGVWFVDNFVHPILAAVAWVFLP